MLSFSKVLTFAAVAFGTLSQAAPFDPRDVSIEARASDPVQLQIILTDVKTQLASKLEPIYLLTPSNATVSAVHPILEDVNVILYDVTELVSKLVGGPVEEILVDVNGVRLAVNDVVKLVRDVLAEVFEALKVVYELVTDISELLDILPILVETITGLLKAVIEITFVVYGNPLVVKLQALVGAGSLVAGVLSSLSLLPISLQ